MRNGVTRKLHTWDEEADKRLLEAVEIYGLNNWQLGTLCALFCLYVIRSFSDSATQTVATNVSEDATGAQCQKRFLDSIDPAIKGGPWSTDEDEKRMRAVEAFTTVPVDVATGGKTSSRKARSGVSWTDVALFVPGRTNNQCREHYERMGKGRKGRDAKGKGKGKERGGGGEVLTARNTPASEAGASTDRTRTPTPSVGAAEGDEAPVTPKASMGGASKRKPSTGQTRAAEETQGAPGKKRKVGRPRKSVRDSKEGGDSGSVGSTTQNVDNESAHAAAPSVQEDEASPRRSARLKKRK